MKDERIYLDHAATSPLRSEVAGVLSELAGQSFGNPNSIHREGQAARALIDRSRQAAADWLGVGFTEALFTSGATEANNLAIFSASEIIIAEKTPAGIISRRTGRLTSGAARRIAPHFIISSLEHPSVRKPAEHLAAIGRISLTVIPADENGVITAEAVRAAIKPETVLISVMLVSNDLGTVQPLRGLCKIRDEVRQNRQKAGEKTPVYLHTDAVQAAPYLNLKKIDADLLTISAHKCGGPLGVGILRHKLGFPLVPLTRGGAQEQGLRAGTENTLAVAASEPLWRLIGDDAARAKRAELVAKRREKLERLIGGKVIGDKAERAPHIAAISFAGQNAAELQIKFDLAGLAVSVGSACSSGAMEPSASLAGLPLSDEVKSGLVRFSLSEATLDEEIERAAEIVKGTGPLPGHVPVIPVSKPRVAVGLSGGVDSSVAAALLKEQGYDVIGFFLRNWSAAINESGFCPWVEDSASARAVADHLGIPFYVLDFEELYKREVIDPFFADYAAGKTPNPDVLCNKFIKFGAFLEAAERFGCELIATGHYAQTNNGQLLRGIDPGKDQSYFLWTLTADILKKTLFPIGHLTKPEVRKLAEKYGLPTAKRKDSQGICFIGPISVRQFLRDNLPTVPGDVVTPDGQVVGRHDGLAFATIGQRRAMGVSGTGEALYVAAKDPLANTLIAVPENHPLLFKDKFRVEDISTVSGAALPSRALVVVRYHHPATVATLTPEGQGYDVLLDKPERAITLGQSAVFFDLENPDLLLGGGVIE